MTPREILALFCAHPMIPRDYLRSPWRAPGHGMVAANGHILVVLPDDGGELADEPTAHHLAGCVGRFLEKWPGGPLWHKLSAIDLPARYQCAPCFGTGVYRYINCSTCSGEGATPDCAICTACNGDGILAVTPDNSMPGVERMTCVNCVNCGGSGKAFQEVAVGEGTYSADYLAILAKLPGCEISPRTDEGSAFRFDGGHGWLMPVRAGV